MLKTILRNEILLKFFDNINMWTKASSHDPFGLAEKTAISLQGGDNKAALQALIELDNSCSLKLFLTWMLIVLSS